MRRKILFAVFLFSLIFNIVFVIDLMSDRHLGKAKDGNKIVLTDQQKKKISEESEVILNDNIKLEAELKKCRLDLYNLLNSEQPDKSKIENCINTISEIQKKIQMNTVEQLLIYKKHMNKEQCKCFLKEFGEKMDVHHKCDENCNCNK